MHPIPPSPVLDFPPTLFMARARVVCASKDMLPKLMAPEAKDYSSYQGISVLTKFTTNDISHNMWGQQTIYSKSAIYGRYTAVISGTWL